MKQKKKRFTVSPEKLKKFHTHFDSMLPLLLLIILQIECLTSSSDETYCNNTYNVARGNLLRYPNYNWSLSEWARVSDACETRFQFDKHAIATLQEPKNGSSVFPNTNIRVSLKLNVFNDVYVCCHDEHFESTQCFRGREGYVI